MSSPSSFSKATLNSTSNSSSPSSLPYSSHLDSSPQPCRLQDATAAAAVLACIRRGGRGEGLLGGWRGMIVGANVGGGGSYIRGRCMR